MTDTLNLVEEMARISASMVALAVANEWDQLVEQERQFTDLRRSLEKLEPAGSQAGDLDSTQQRHKAALLQRMLDDQVEIRRHVDPWMSSTRKMLSEGVRDRAVRAAYGAHGP